MSCLISKPVFMETPDNLIINLLYFFVPGEVDYTKKSERLKSLKRSTLPIATSLNGISIPSNPNLKKITSNRNSTLNISNSNKNRFFDNFKDVNIKNIHKLNKMNMAWLIKSYLVSSFKEKVISRIQF